MPHPPSASNSSGTSIKYSREDLLDLNLPDVGPGEELLPSDGFAYEAQMAHARFLLSMKTEADFEKREALRQLEPFRWID